MKNQLQQLADAGQSVWIDNLRRSMFASGELDRLIGMGLRGMTSNPSIFEKAIGTGSDYDEQLRSLIGSERNAEAIFWDLAVEDIRSACDAFTPVFMAQGGHDGFVSLEVSPLLAHDTSGTIAMAKELWARVDRPNLMVKIPGTAEGIPAIEEATYAGLNINVTLVFSVEMYEKAAYAYIRGLERRIAEKLPVDRIASVNSVFVSRIDTAVDKLLQARIDKGEKNLEPLLGKAGIAGLKITYERFRAIFEGAAFTACRKAGAAAQRPLWASTSTKNPNYDDLMYVEEVVAPQTVNTMPENTLSALLDHGTITPNTISRDLDGARAMLRALHDAHVSLFDVTRQLQIDGVKLFSDAYGALLGAIVYKQKQLASGAERVALSLGSAQQHYDNALSELASKDFLKRMWAKDATLWTDEPAAAAIITHALGWLDIPQRSLESVAELKSCAQDVRADFDDVVVCGMGGSSLAPDVLSQTFGKTDRFARLLVLDSTDPQQIEDLESSIDLPRTLFCISSKSGTTTEPNAFYAYFHAKMVKAVGAANAGKHFIAITDPGTPLLEEARRNAFRTCFPCDPNIGGRYSALSFFGMVPAALAGYDVNLLLDRGLGAMHANDKNVDVRNVPGARLGAAIGGLARNGRDKLTIVTHPAVRAFGAWVEQLVAESTGKLGKGVVPVEGERLGSPQEYGDDRLFVYVGATLANPDRELESRLSALEAAGYPVMRLAMNDAYDLGEQFYLWEVAIAAAGVLLHIDAFDQPNVQESKDNTKALLEQYLRTGEIDEPAPSVSLSELELTPLSGSAGATSLRDVLAQVRPGDYVAITAYVARNEEHARVLGEVRETIRKALCVATTVGFGPRFLHSTGQLHKGGPPSVVLLQIVADEPSDPAIPGMNVGFRTLLAAQALGDLQALDKRARRGTRVHLKGEIERGLQSLKAAVDDALAVRT
ncbi:MAG TPA: bifunctional transaldolase/phosoglucose isomerase [Candidatus Dormibacteraeota bacterium]|nr:bifunctional transaldolase/phosoglucose isomerase [Candidatus Dormibacteraeota bacterium]